MAKQQTIKLALEQNGHTVLLVTLFLMLLASPFLHQFPHLSWFLAILLVLVLIAAASTVARQKRMFHIALILGLPALGSEVAILAVQWDWLLSLRYISTALFLFWVCGLLLGDIVLRSHTVTGEVILGAINVYLMIGVAFAFVYGLIEHLQPGSFTGLDALAQVPDTVTYFLYFSFITMSTLGYGDISPLTPHGMTAAYLEAIFGQLYLAILVARLVSMYIGRKAPQE